MDPHAVTHWNALIFDFDGTICFLFKNYALHHTALTLHESMKRYGVRFDADRDAFDVFEEILLQTTAQSNARQQALMDANHILTCAEIEAIRTAEPVKGFVEIFPTILKAGMPIGVATNNSSPCVQAYIKRYFPQADLPIVGRNGLHPEWMKPNPWSIFTVLQEMRCDAEHAVLIGDTQRDYDAALNAGCQFIGLASTKVKEQRLSQVLTNQKMVHDFDELLHII